MLLRTAGENKTHKGMLDKIKEEDFEMARDNATTYVTNNEKTMHKLARMEDAKEDEMTIAEEVQKEEGQDNPLDDRSTDEVKEEEINEDLYNLKNFTI